MNRPAGKPSAGTIIAALLLPPLSVFWSRGPGAPFLLSCVLTLAAFVPGVIHALVLAFTGDRGTLATA